MQYYKDFVNGLENKTLQDFFKFTFVRDPYTRYASGVLNHVLRPVTYDLDVENEVRKGLERNGFVHKDNFLGLGVNKPGRRAVEGLLPQNLVTSVNNEHLELVQQAMYGMKEEQKSAKNSLKKHYLTKFQAECEPTEEWFGEFYKAVKVINAGLVAK